MAGSEKAQHTVNLKYVDIAFRRIRYVVLPSHIVCQQKPKLKSVPMFLGADVLHQCGKCLKNLGRLHSKNASDGLATKIFFPPNCRVEGIRGAAHAFWFYSIQGLFKVAFNFYSNQELKVLLRKLQDLWISCLDEPDLLGDLTIEELANANFDADLFSVLEDIREKPIIQENDSCLANYIGCQESLQSIDSRNLAKESVQNCQNDLQATKLHVTSVADDVATVSLEVEANTDESSPAIVEHVNIANEITYHEEPIESPDKEILEYETKIKKVISKLFSEFKEEPSLNIITSYIESFVFLIINEKSNIIEQQSTSFPIKLIKDYMESIKDKEEAHMPLSHELALHIIAGWVGEMSYLFKDLIKHNVDAFKQAYINDMSELPSAEDIVRTVYPPAMYNLIYLWLRGPGERVDEESRLSSLCLLILELLNGHPISGLGHWVYSYI